MIFLKTSSHFSYPLSFGGEVQKHYVENKKIISLEGNLQDLQWIKKYLEQNLLNLCREWNKSKFKEILVQLSKQFFLKIRANLKIFVKD